MLTHALLYLRFIINACLRVYASSHVRAHNKSMYTQQALNFACDADHRQDALGTALGQAVLNTPIGQLEYDDMHQDDMLQIDQEGMGI